MCRSPEEVLQEACTFIDVPYLPRFVTREDHFGEMQEAHSVSHYENVFGEVSTDSIGKGRSNMSSTEKDKIRPHIGEVLRTEGYNPVD
jgi:hypothetical protein